LADYAPEVIAAEARRYPQLTVLADGLGGRTTSRSVSIPLDCTDGFNEAYYGRPERLLDPQAQLSCSAWSFVETHVHERFVTDLARDLETDAWDDRHRALRHQPTFDGSLVLSISEP